MGAALAVVERGEDLRTMAHDALDKWLDQVEAETATAPTLREISERFVASRFTVLSACLETVIRQRYAAELQQTEAVCGCGRRLRWRRLDAKEISTLHGCVTLHRPYFYCDVCGVGFHPLDAKLGLAPAHHQYDIQERTTRLAAELPYGVSDKQFEQLTGRVGLAALHARDAQRRRRGGDPRARSSRRNRDRRPHQDGACGWPSPARARGGVRRGACPRRARPVGARPNAAPGRGAKPKDFGSICWVRRTA
jgi:hypothetical protein